MKIIETGLKGAYIIEPTLFGDHRGWFMESYNLESMLGYGIDVQFVQDNHSFSSLKGTLRGLHYQEEPHSQTKLVRCTRGEIVDVIVDLREDSPTYLKFEMVTLSENNKLQLFIPPGFAHGFLTLSDNVEIMYKVDKFYSREHDAGIIYSDCDLNIPWSTYLAQSEFILSDKDMDLPTLKKAKPKFTYERK